VSTIQEIEAAIRSLSPEERGRLAEDLPALVPELDGDAKWERIVRDPQPRPALEKLLDEVEAEHEKHPGKFRETSEEEFDRNS
jgi:hypothetical protein